MSWSPGLLFLFALDAVWVVSIFVAPFTIPPGTFADTVGRANVVDHWDLYAQPSFNWYAKIIYVIGDAECHQLASRSFILNGNQMPICARDTSLFLFGALGLFWAMLTPPERTVSGGIANAFPSRIQRWAHRIGMVKFTFLVVGLGLLPAAVDGFSELLSGGGYESWNGTRVLTGIPGGLVVGLLLGMMVKSIRQFGLEYRRYQALADPNAAKPPSRRDVPFPGNPTLRDVWKSFIYRRRAPGTR